MKERDKHKLEGLLKARSADMGRRRRPRPRSAEADPTFERPRPEPNGQGALPPTRECGECGEQILPRRLRAMPSASRCLDCQRAFEHATSGS